MLTFFKEIFVWWNQQTIGTRIQTLFFGKFVGKDSLGNKYYQNKSGKRWVIYNGEVDASKVPEEWYSWLQILYQLLKLIKAKLYMDFYVVYYQY